MKKNEELAQTLRERAARLSRPSENEPVDTKRVVVFRLHQELYGLEISEVVEILQPERVTAVPGAPLYIDGVTNIRGDIVTVMDLRQLLTGEAGAAEKDETQIIVVEAKEYSAGLMVDKVIGIFDIQTDMIDPPLHTLEKLKADHLLGEFKLEKDLIGLLNATNILEANGS